MENGGRGLEMWGARTGATKRGMIQLSNVVMASGGDCVIHFKECRVLKTQLWLFCIFFWPLILHILLLRIWGSRTMGWLGSIKPVPYDSQQNMWFWKCKRNICNEIVHLVKVCFSGEVQGNMFLSLLEPACKRSIRLPVKGELVEIDPGVLLEKLGSYLRGKR